MSYRGEREQYESYRPPYNRPTFQRRPTDHNDEPHSRRPRDVSRPGSHREHHSTEVDPSENIVMHSSRSTLRRLTDMDPAVTKDPRKERETSSVTPSIAQSPSAKSESTLGQYMRELVKQVFNDEKLQQAEVKLEAARQSERDAKKNNPANIPLLDILARNRKAEEVTHTNLSHLASECKQSITTITDRLPVQVKELLRGELSSSTQSKQQSETDVNLKTQVHDFSTQISLLKEQIKDRDVEITELKSAHRNFMTDVRSVQQDLKRVESSAPDPVRETPRSPPNHDLEDEFEILKAECKVQKHQIANLSNTFVGAAEFKNITVQISSLKESIGKAEQTIAQVQSDMNSSKITTENTITPTDSGKLQEKITTMQDDVSKLTSFKGHYENFYTKTLEDFKDLNTRLAATDNKTAKLQESTLQYMKDINITCDRQQKALDALTKQHKMMEEKFTASIAAIRTELDTWKGSALKSINTAHTQLASAISDIKSLQISVDQTSHSIQSLDTRYSSISTQKLYHSIMATIQPLIPRLSEIPDILNMRNELVQLRQSLGNNAQDDQVLRVPPDELATQQQAHSAQVAELKQEATQLREADNHRLSELKRLADKLEDVQTTVQEQGESFVDKTVLHTELVKLRNDLGSQQSSNDHNADYEAKNKLKELDGSLESVRSEIETMMVTVGENNKAIEDLRLETEGLHDLRTRIEVCQADLRSYEQRIPKVKTDLAEVQALDQTIQNSTPEAKAHDKLRRNNATANAELTDIKEELSDSKLDDEELRSRLERVGNAVFPIQDRYILCNNVASKVNEATLIEKFKNCPVKTVQFYGKKLPEIRKSSRYALVWISGVPDVDVTIDKVVQTENGKKWVGRTVEISRVNRDDFRKLWMEGADSVSYVMSTVVTVTPSVGTDRASETPAVTKGPVFPIGKFQNHPIEDEDTIEVKSVARSSVLPTDPAAQENDIEVEDSEVEGILTKFGAVRDGRRSLARVTSSTRQSTPSTRSLPKRTAPDSGSSRPSKRNRPG